MGMRPLWEAHRERGMEEWVLACERMSLVEVRPSTMGILNWSARLDLWL